MCAPIAGALRCFPRIPPAFRPKRPTNRTTNHPTNRHESSDETRPPPAPQSRTRAQSARRGSLRTHGRRAAPAIRIRRSTPLIFFPEIGTPISEACERPRIPVRGRFRFGVRKESFTHTRAAFRGANGIAHAFFRPSSILSRTSGHRGPSTGPAEEDTATGAQALRRDARRGGDGETRGHTDCRLDTAGNAKHPANGFQRHGFAFHPVRAALPWRMPKTGRGCFAMTNARWSGSD